MEKQRIDPEDLLFGSAILFAVIVFLLFFAIYS